MRCASGPCFRRWSRAYAFAVLHEFRVAQICGAKDCVGTPSFVRLRAESTFAFLPLCTFVSFVVNEVQKREPLSTKEGLRTLMRVPRSNETSAKPARRKCLPTAREPAVDWPEILGAPLPEWWRARHR